VRCREARQELPAYADDEPTGELARHVASCPRCSAELAGYRGLVARMAALQLEDLEPPVEYLERVLGELPVGSLADRLRLAAQARSARYALASLGGAVVGAGAIGLVWWRLGHRAVRRAAGSDLPMNPSDLVASKV
jgi:hypothetical protein